MGRILVTGAFGYLGLGVLRALRGQDVVAFGHAPRNEAARALLGEGLRRVEGDLLAVASTLEREGPFDAVVHLAGGGGAAKIAAEPEAAVRTNVRGTTELAAAARRHGVRRLLFASTIAVYGTMREHGRAYRESDDARPDDLYGIIKEAAEHAWVALAGGTSLRLANVYGAGCGVDLGLSGAAERFARAAAAGGDLTVFGTGGQKIDYVHIDDVARAIVLAVTHAGELPPHLNVGGGQPIAIGDLARLHVDAAATLGKAARLVERPAPPGKAWPDRSLDITLARQTLEWTPSVSYEEGVLGLVRMMARGAET